MALSNVCSPAQPTSWCPSTTDEVLPSTLGLLPPGPAWDGARNPGTNIDLLDVFNNVAGLPFASGGDYELLDVFGINQVALAVSSQSGIGEQLFDGFGAAITPLMNTGSSPPAIQHLFWRAISNTTAWVYKRLCEYVPEFYCFSVNESRDQWVEEYDLSDECGVYRDNLCAKVILIGGGDCALFVAIALDAGWVVSCKALDTHRPMPGCFEVNCTELGPSPILAAHMPYVERTRHEPTLGGVEFACPQPPPLPIAECFQVGCTPLGPDPSQLWSPRNSRTDSSGFYAYGSGGAFDWVVVVDLFASYVLQGKQEPVLDVAQNRPGLFEVGCTPICGATDIAPLLCFLETIKPAHTVLHVQVDAPQPVSDAFFTDVIGPVEDTPSQIDPVMPGVMDAFNIPKGFVFDPLFYSRKIDVHDAFNVTIY